MSAVVQMSGKIVIVTGANTGIGKETARHFYLQGATVICACRSVSRGEAAIADIRASSPNSTCGTIEVMSLDLSDLHSVGKFASTFLSKYSQLHLLVNNAGMNSMGAYEGPFYTKQGYEILFGTNYLGHFLLTQLLLPTLVQSQPSRIVHVASFMHWFGLYTKRNNNSFAFNFQRFSEEGVGNGDVEEVQAGSSKKADDNQSLLHTSGGAVRKTRPKVHPLWKFVEDCLSLTYSDSKLAMVIHAVDLQRRLKASHPNADVRVFAVCPGFVSSDIWRHTLVGALWRPLTWVRQLTALSPEQGCGTTVAAATRSDLVGGQYLIPIAFRCCTRIFRWTLYGICSALARLTFGCSVDEPSPKARDPVLAAQLWDLSIKHCADHGIRIPEMGLCVCTRKDGRREQDP